MKHDVLSTFRMLATLNLIDVKFQSSEQNSLCKWELSKVKQSKCPLTWNVYAHIKGETNKWKKIWVSAPLSVHMVSKYQNEFPKKLKNVMDSSLAFFATL